MRSVPRLIDRPGRTGEVILVFMVPLFLLRTIDPLFGLAAAVVCSLLFLRLSVGRPQGYLLHRACGLGLRVQGLLDPRLRRLAR
jgi:hypothetical protein